MKSDKLAQNAWICVLQRNKASTKGDRGQPIEGKSIEQNRDAGTYWTMRRVPSEQGGGMD